jgi:hypothetical protein
MHFPRFANWQLASYMCPVSARTVVSFAVALAVFATGMAVGAGLGWLTRPYNPCSPNPTQIC